MRRRGRSAGRPCVVKADLAGAVSKSDEGAVRLGITDVGGGECLPRSPTERFGDRLNGVVVHHGLLQGRSCRSPPRGIRRSGPSSSSVPGREAEVRADRAVLVAPITAAGLADAVAGLHLAPLFGGFRGRPALALDAVVELVTQVAMLMPPCPRSTKSTSTR